jgi:hypothetical protein
VDEADDVLAKIASYTNVAMDMDDAFTKPIPRARSTTTAGKSMVGTTTTEHDVQL